MVYVITYEMIELTPEKLKRAYNDNLRISWKPILRKLVKDDYLKDKKTFNEKVLPDIMEYLRANRYRGIFDVRAADKDGFFSLLDDFIKV